jgi:transposase-like protein
MSKRESKSVEMFRLVEELESSGYDRQVFASQHGISLSKLDYWRHRYHHQNREGTSGFIELRSAPIDSSIEIVYSNGVTIRLSGDSSPVRLRELVTLL